MIDVSAGIIRRGDGRILICQRGEGRKNAHLWEFPGGKWEDGEDAADCLKRELMEELSLPVTNVRAWCTTQAQGIRFTFLTAETDAAPVLTEHEDAKFVTPRELLAYPFCPGDVPVARRLALGNIRHVFWDFDGTLLDSYPLMTRALVAAAADYGIAIAPERALDLMKENLTHALVTLAAENGVEAESLRAAFRRHEAGELEKGLPPVAGIPETLRALQSAGMRHYVATHRDLQCRELLEKAGLLDAFTGFVTAEDKLPRKPAPDMMHHLMRKYHLTPGQCAMVGDRPLDTQSGIAAGMVGVLLDEEGRFPEAQADVTVRDIRELMTWWGGICG